MLIIDNIIFEIIMMSLDKIAIGRQLTTDDPKNRKQS